MKKMFHTLNAKTLLALTLIAALCFAAGAAMAETTQPTVAAPTSDTSPALYVAQKTASSVVGVVTSTETWDRSTGQTTTTPVSQGSGVCIAEGGYVMTNNHVIANGTSYQVLMPSGEKADATLVGADSSTDIAVLKITDEAQTALLTPVEVGSSADLMVGATVVAIGNPGGSVLANTVTQGIVSGLERDVSASGSATRAIAYIQHDAAINNGNSGGGLFDYMGRLVGINTLKYSGSAYSSVSFESLGFAIPVDTAVSIANQLMENGKVIRPAMGVTVADWQGPDEPMNNYAPASVCVYEVVENSPAEAAGFEQYDFIYSIDGVRVTCYRELTAEMDKHEAGDTVEVVVVRYKNIATGNNNSGRDYYGSDGSSGNYGAPSASGFEYVTLQVTLAILD